MVSELQILRHLSQRILTHQVGTLPGKLPLGKLWETLEKLRGNHAVQHGVAEKFKTLVVGRTETAMRQGLMKKGLFDESMAQ